MWEFAYMNQQALWHETPEEALRALVDALGGPKAVGSAMFPEKTLEDARRLVLKWCDPDRIEKPGLDQLLLLLRKGREHGCHVFAAFLMSQSGYAEPTPVEPKDEAAELQRAFIRSVAEQKALLERLQRVQVRAAS